MIHCMKKKSNFFFDNDNLTKDVLTLRVFQFSEEGQNYFCNQYNPAHKKYL